MRRLSPYADASLHEEFRVMMVSGWRQSGLEGPSVLLQVSRCLGSGSPAVSVRTG